ncbi:hypothetical protein JMJ77_0003671 [Colletotrichum scovillei]|uniref:Uncharacterized protein n=1 Tax=Colletotrichum scovillei TaxID=1209932 RepID=A0A9P7QRN4_9PEZI|nr:hypothetical protein JMJ78_0005185 [Colletotrichum scovillei]KAG7041569.1 hypothetical protein JMJ77_0003671 [Colletotrichum scovillei]KAG7061597.1 hypothetical protein JMJ76_0001157 [Colletotrichum scovillei]
MWPKLPTPRLRTVTPCPPEQGWLADQRAETAPKIGMGTPSSLPSINYQLCSNSQLRTEQ